MRPPRLTKCRWKVTIQAPAHTFAFLSLLLVFSLVICGTMGTGKGAKAEENITTEESGKNPQVESGSVEEEEPCETPEEDIDLKP